MNQTVGDILSVELRAREQRFGDRDGHLRVVGVVEAGRARPGTEGTEAVVVEGTSGRARWKPRNKI